MVSATTKMFVALRRHDEAARSLMIDVMQEAFGVGALPADRGCADVRSGRARSLDEQHADHVRMADGR
ncbi:MAG: hypothetical protein JO268_01795 [Pseudonocardiales bacterium]|nr:hypothetical protein [Pseudonocardiales bacterium]